jgi:hypothetical protein
MPKWVDERCFSDPALSYRDAVVTVPSSSKMILRFTRRRCCSAFRSREMPSTTSFRPAALASASKSSVRRRIDDSGKKRETRGKLCTVTLGASTAQEREPTGKRGRGGMREVHERRERKKSATRSLYARGGVSSGCGWLVYCTLSPLAQPGSSSTRRETQESALRRTPFFLPGPFSLLSRRLAVNSALSSWLRHSKREALRATLPDRTEQSSSRFQQDHLEVVRLFSPSLSLLTDPPFDAPAVYTAAAARGRRAG